MFDPALKPYRGRIAGAYAMMLFGALGAGACMVLAFLVEPMRIGIGGTLMSLLICGAGLKMLSKSLSYATAEIEAMAIEQAARRAPAQRRPMMPEAIVDEHQEMQELLTTLCKVAAAAMNKSKSLGGHHVELGHFIADREAERAELLEIRDRVEHMMRIGSGEVGQWPRSPADLDEPGEPTSPDDEVRPAPGWLGRRRMPGPPLSSERAPVPPMPRAEDFAPPRVRNGGTPPPTLADTLEKDLRSAVGPEAQHEAASGMHDRNGS